MFDDRAFATWPRILLGAFGFAALFGTVAVLTDLLFEERLYLSRWTLGLALLAFVGYLGVAAAIRSRRRHEP